MDIKTAFRKKLQFIGKDELRKTLYIKHLKKDNLIFCKFYFRVPWENKKNRWITLN